MSSEMAEPRKDEPKRRALLIGAPVGGLRGVARDIERMKQTLGAWGLTIVERVGEPHEGEPGATREGILGALRELVRWAEEVGPEAVVVIYYSGHGARTRIVAQGGKPPGPWFSHLVPVDIERGNPCGVADFELAGILDELASATKNVTMILDCCYSAAIRDDDEEMLVRGIPEREVMPSEQEELLRGLEEWSKRPDSEGNPHVVRLVASSASSIAIEGSQPDRSWAGYFTFELCKALDEAKALRWPWQTILGQVRERVLARRPEVQQRPELSGPRWRLPFSLEEARDGGEQSALACDARGTPWMRAGRLHGLSIGDRVEVQWSEPVEGQDERRNRDVGARLAEVCDDSARLELDPVEGAGRPPAGSAVLVRSVAVRKTVRIEGDAGRAEGLRGGLAASLRLALVDEGPSDFVVTVGAGGLLVTGPAWLARTPRLLTKEGAAEVVEDVDGLARAAIVLDVLEGACAGAQEPWGDWGVVAFVTEPGGEQPRPLVPGETLAEGTRIYVEVRYLEVTGPKLHVNVLDRDVSGRVWLVNRAEPAGVQVEADHTRWVGRRPHGGTLGLRLEWPSCVPRDADGQEELIVVVSTRALDLRPLLERPGEERREEPTRGEDPSGLGAPLRWSMRRIGFRVRAAHHG